MLPILLAGLISVCIGGVWILRRLGRATTAPPVTRPCAVLPTRSYTSWKLVAVAGAGVICWAVWTKSHEVAEAKRPNMFAEWKQHLVNSAKQRALADAQRSLSKLSAAAADIQVAVKALEAMAQSLQHQ